MFCAAFTPMSCPPASEGDISSARSNRIVRPRTMAASDTINRATVKGYEGASLGINVAESRPLLLRRMGASRKLDQRDHVGLDVVRNFGIGLQFRQGSWTRHWFAVRFKTFGIEFQGFRSVA